MPRQSATTRNIQFAHLAPYILLSLFAFGATAPPVGQGLLILDVSRLHTTHHTWQDYPGRGISSSQTTLPGNTQHSQQTNIHVPRGIRTHYLSRRAVADPRLRPLCHWHRHLFIYFNKFQCGNGAISRNIAIQTSSIK